VPPPAEDDEGLRGFRLFLRRFRRRWPYLPLYIKVAIIGLGLITVFEVVRVSIKLVTGAYW
jgi:hypothetical protein